MGTVRIFLITLYTESKINQIKRAEAHGDGRVTTYNDNTVRDNKAVIVAGGVYVSFMVHQGHLGGKQRASQLNLISLLSDSRADLERKKSLPEGF